MLSRVLGIVVALVALAGLVVVPGGQGSVAARGGNHDCDTTAGTMRSDHFQASGDNIVVGYSRAVEGKFPPMDIERLLAENTRNDGSQPSAISCSDGFPTWVLFTSRLGPGDDSVRLDAVGFEQKYKEPALGPLPKRIETLISGGAGSDRLLGHTGFDKLKGAAGDDLIKAADGKRDRVSCGAGDDKAVVDRRDRATGCEKLIER